MSGGVDPRHCPALLVSAPASGQGKTTATAALARWHRRQGRRVRVFKAGPDFLDPMVLERASGHRVYQLDLWMGGEAHCRELLWQAAAEADVILVEGVMGLFDGMSSTAGLAMRLGLPVLAVIDASGMAQTFGAIAHGLATYRPGLTVAGVLANRVASDGHAAMLHESLPQGMKWFGGLPRDEGFGMPSRHLGLVRPDEVADIDARLDRAAEALGRLHPEMPEPVSFDLLAQPAPVPRLLDGVRIAIARDEAFAFLYHANVDTLLALGAEPLYFSPLREQALPPGADALYLPGGYPELHLAALSGNEAMKRAVADHHAQGRPIVAECGGMLALLDRLADKQGRQAAMWGLLPGDAALQPRLVNLGMHEAAWPRGSVRGHTFHHAAMRSPLTPSGLTRAQRFNGKPEAIYQVGRLHASFLHLYFPSNPAAVAALFSPDAHHVD